MKRFLPGFLALLCFAGKAGATEPASPVVEQFVDTMTVNGIQITTGTAVELTQYNEPYDYAWRQLRLQNVDRSTNTIFVSEQASVSTTEGSINAGFEVNYSTNSSATFTLKPRQRLYGICDKVNTHCNAVMIRAH